MTISSPHKESSARWQVASRTSSLTADSAPETMDLEPALNAALDELEAEKRRTPELGSSMPSTAASPGPEVRAPSSAASSTANRLAELVRWVPGSNQELLDAEDQLLSFVSAPHELVHVHIGQPPDGQGSSTDIILASDAKQASLMAMFPWIAELLPKVPGAIAEKALDAFAHAVGLADRNGVDEEGNCYINTLLVGDVAQSFVAAHPRDPEGNDVTGTGAGAGAGSRRRRPGDAECKELHPSPQDQQHIDNDPKPENGENHDSSDHDATLKKVPSILQRLMSLAGIHSYGSDAGKSSGKVAATDDWSDGEEQPGMSTGSGRAEGAEKDSTEELSMHDSLDILSPRSNSSAEEESFEDASSEPLAHAPWPAPEAFSSKKPNLVMVHGYAACLGFYFRNFDTLSQHFNIYAIDQLGWGASSRPSFTPKTAEEAETWFVEALEQWRQEVGLQKFVLLGHSFGGYISARYALKYPQFVEHLVLVGPAGFNHVSAKMERFRATWKGMLLGALWETNLTPQLAMRLLGPVSGDWVKRATRQRWANLGASGQEDLPQDQVEAFAEYILQSFVAPMSGEFCMKYIFSLGAFARRPLIDSAMSWLTPTTFIYGEDDIMDYRAGLGAAKLMPVPVEVLLIKEVGHMLFIEKPTLFNQAVLHGCRSRLPLDSQADAVAATQAVLPYIIPLDQNHKIPTDSNSDALFEQEAKRGTIRLASGWGIG